MDGEEPFHSTFHDHGDNPLWVDGALCWRRYKFGGFITMRIDSAGDFVPHDARATYHSLPVPLENAQPATPRDLLGAVRAQLMQNGFEKTVWSLQYPGPFLRAEGVEPPLLLHAAGGARRSILRKRHFMAALGELVCAGYESAGLVVPDNAHFRFMAGCLSPTKREHLRLDVFFVLRRGDNWEIERHPCST